MVPTTQPQNRNVTNDHSWSFVNKGSKELKRLTNCAGSSAVHQSQSGPPRKKANNNATKPQKAAGFSQLRNNSLLKAVITANTTKAKTNDGTPARYISKFENIDSPEVLLSDGTFSENLRASQRHWRPKTDKRNSP